MSEQTETTNDYDDCEFCAGRAAAAKGELRSANPYPSANRFDDAGEPTQWFLWDVGWSAPPEGWWEQCGSSNG